MAAASGMANSNVASATYTIQQPVATPTLSPEGGTYSTPKTVTLSDTVGGATIYYTTDGSTPTPSSTRYTGPLSVNQSRPSRRWRRPPAWPTAPWPAPPTPCRRRTPTFNPPGGPYLLPRSVSISSASPGVTIYYTTNGSTPTTSSTQYTGPILVILPTTIKAIAVRTGWTQSPMASATYSLLGL